MDTKVHKQSFNQGREAGIREALEAVRRNKPTLHEAEGYDQWLLDREAISALLNQPPKGEQK